MHNISFASNVIKLLVSVIIKCACVIMFYWYMDYCCGQGVKAYGGGQAWGGGGEVERGQEGTGPQKVNINWQNLGKHLFGQYSRVKVCRVGGEISIGSWIWESGKTCAPQTKLQTNKQTNTIQTNKQTNKQIKNNKKKHTNKQTKSFIYKPTCLGFTSETYMYLWTLDKQLHYIIHLYTYRFSTLIHGQV